MPWTAPTPSCSTSALWPRWPTSPRRTSSAASAPPSGRRRTVTCSGGGWSARCSCCARATAASPTFASTWLHEPGDLQPHVPGDRRRGAVELSRGEWTDGGPQLLSDVGDAAGGGGGGSAAIEQFWRGRRSNGLLA